MTQNPTPATDSGADVVPRPRYPIKGQTADAESVTFAWSETPGVGEYVLQVARDPEFEDQVALVTVGDATSVTLYSTLEAAESDYHWRVRAGKKGAWGPAACFRPAGAEHLRNERIAREQRAHEAAAAELRRHMENEERVPVAIPEGSDSSDRTVMIVLSVLIISFIILLVILMIFGHVTYPAEATAT
jgi:hypothetical protein